LTVLTGNNLDFSHLFANILTNASHVKGMKIVAQEQKIPANIVTQLSIADDQAAGDLLRKAQDLVKRKVVVLDDDPTGVQTVHDVPVFTKWDAETLKEAFLEEGSMFFV